MAGNPNPDPNPNPEPDPNPDPTPQYMTSEQVTQMVTGAIERVKKSLTTDTSKSIEALKTSLPELIKGAVSELKPAPDPSDPPKDPKDAKPDPRITALEQRVADALSALENEKKARVETEERARNDAARNALRAVLQPHIKSTEALDMATSLLFDAERRISFDDDGEPIFTIKQPPAAGMPEEDMRFPLPDGVQRWLKTDRAKFFLPAPDPAVPSRRGSPQPRATGRDGNGIPVYDKPAETDEERVRRANERAAALSAKYPDLTFE